jgi:hypothetical protein
MKITPTLQAAIDLIAAENGCGATTKEHLKQDNMTWFSGLDLIEGLGVSMQKAGGIMRMLEHGGLAVKSDNRTVTAQQKANGEVAANWTLTDAGIDAATNLDD